MGDGSNPQTILCLLLLTIAFHSWQSFAAVLPAILWDPRNPLFNCENLEIKVAINDRLNILCPNDAMNLGELEQVVLREKMYENAYLLQPDKETHFLGCNATGGRSILLCDNPGTFQYVTLSFRRMSGSSAALIYIPGKTYYLIGTSEGTQATLNNQVGGRCSGQADTKYKLRLKIRVCTPEEITIYKNCTTCTSHSCYSQGCERYSKWSKTNDFLWNGTHCLNRETRACNASSGYCTESLERRVLSFDNCTFPDTEKCSTAMASKHTTLGITTSSIVELGSSSSYFHIQSTDFSGLVSSMSVVQPGAASAATVARSPNGTSRYSTVSSQPSAISPSPSNCSCSVRTVVIQSPSTGQQQGDDSTRIGAVYLVVPSVIGGIILGIAVGIVSKYFLSSNSRKKVTPYRESQPETEGTA